MIPPDYGTPKRLITMAYRDCGILAVDTEPGSAQLLDGMNRLADLLYFHQTQGLKLWLLEDIPLPLVAAKQMYTCGPTGDVAGPKPFRVEYAYAMDNTQQNRRPLIPLSYGDWTWLSNTQQAGQVTQYFVDKQLQTLNIHLWLIPDSEQVNNGAVHMVLRKKAEHLVNLYEDMTFPTEWYLALRWALADELATGQPSAVQQRCAIRANSYIEALQNFDIEDVPFRITADQSWTQRSGFNG